MIVKSLALSDFRNYDLQELSFHHGINIFYGDNAQGKTNILEGIYLCMTLEFLLLGWIYLRKYRKSL